MCYDENIRLLANAVIIRACEDYKDDVRQRPAIEHWIMSEHFMLLSRGAVSQIKLINQLRQEVQTNGKKKAVKKNRVTDFF